MCCRYLLLQEHLRQLLSALGLRGEDIAAIYSGDNYNIAPSVKIPGVRRKQDAGKRKATAQEAPVNECTFLTWGMQAHRTPATAGREDIRSELMGIESNARKPAPLYNACAESYLEKPTFRGAVRARRCLIPASGFYEWERAGRARLPWFFQMRDEKPFFLAGIWQPAFSDASDAADSCVIITTEPNALIRPIHGRMPVIISPENAQTWLGDEQNAAHRLLRPFPSDSMQGHRTSDFVNNVRNTGKQCIAPPGEEQGMLW